VPHEPVAWGRNLRREGGKERRGVIRQEEKTSYPVTAGSNTPYSARSDPKDCRRCLSYTFLKVRRNTRKGNQKSPSPGDGERANTEDRLQKPLVRTDFPEPDIPTRPSFSTARRERSLNLSHLRQTLNPGMPVLPIPPASLDTGWAVACVSRGRLAYRGSVLPIRVADRATFSLIHRVPNSCQKKSDSEV
jgi:hypothetical protein